MSTISPFVGRSVVARTQCAGVFYGTLTLMAGDECILADARRVWYWAGAASLSQLSTEGTKSPRECKFPCKVECIHLLGVVEVLPLTREAFASLEAVEIWSAGTGYVASTIAVSYSGYGSGDVSGSGDGYGEGYDALYGYEYIAFSGEGDDSIDDVVTFSGEGYGDGSGYVAGYGYVTGEGYGDRA